jgi:cardiolipin synthase
MTRSHPVLVSGALALVLSLAACAVPNADRSIAQATHVTGAPKPQIQGADGPLTLEQSRALLAKIGADGDGDKILKRHLAIEEAVAGSPLTADNKITVLPDGASAFRAMAAVIRGARHSLNLEYYTIEDVDLDGDGKKLSDLLLQKRAEGVAINIIYDSYGSSDTPNDFFDRLKKAGVNLLDFHPISPAQPTQALNFNDRDHRKILVADGEVGIVGGVNLSKSYESKSPGSDSGDKAQSKSAEHMNGTPPVEGLTNVLGITTKLPDQWRDTAIRIEGPAIAELQKLYVAQWESEKGPPLDRTWFFPKLEAKGNQVARIIGSTPDQPISRYYVTLVSALRNAETRAWISAAYFVPTPEEMEALTGAAKRGVDVRLLLPDVSDSREAIEAAHSHYTDLLEAGVKIYETKNVVLHSKTVVIDGVWSAIGSSNFDHRSVLFNDEVDAIVLGADTAKALEAVFTGGEQIATAIDREKWEESRPVTERVRGFFARMWEDLL